MRVYLLSIVAIVAMLFLSTVIAEVTDKVSIARPYRSRERSRASAAEKTALPHAYPGYSCTAPSHRYPEPRTLEQIALLTPDDRKHLGYDHEPEKACVDPFNTDISSMYSCQYVFDQRSSLNQNQQKRCVPNEKFRVDVYRMVKTIDNAIAIPQYLVPGNRAANTFGGDVLYINVPRVWTNVQVLLGDIDAESTFISLDVERKGTQISFTVPSFTEVAPSNRHIWIEFTTPIRITKDSDGNPISQSLAVTKNRKLLTGVQLVPTTPCLFLLQHYEAMGVDNYSKDLTRYVECNLQTGGVVCEEGFTSPYCL